ncbi:hypothetical protein [Melittangium boletus]|uniref:hypothetical protein n=1 Tax=Melittangium boletus TaxID=83453 RepID=UPI003DA66BBE
MQDSVKVSVEELRALLAAERIEGLVVTGFVDDGSGFSKDVKPLHRFAQFHPMWDEVYLELGRVLLRLKVVDGSSGLQMERVARMESAFEVDPDDVFGAMSLLRTLLPSGRESARVEQIDYYVDPAGAGRAGKVAALGLALDKGEYLFFDPLDPANGIHVGNVQSRDLWLAWTERRYVPGSCAV